MLSIFSKEEKTLSLIFCLTITINNQQTLFFVYFVSQQNIVTCFNRLTLWVYILNLNEFEQAHGCIYTSKVTGPRQVFQQKLQCKDDCHHSQHRRVVNASFIKGFMILSLTVVKKYRNSLFGRLLSRNNETQSFEVCV